MTSVGLFALAGRLEVARALEPFRPVLLLDPVAREVVWVAIPLAVPERLRTPVAGVAQVSRHWVGRRRVLLGAPERYDHAVGLRRAGQVDRRLREVEPRLGQAHVLDRLGGG